MSETPFTIVIAKPEIEHRKITGTDSSICTVPPGVYTAVDGGTAVVAITLGNFLRELSEKQAAGLGEVLHHAEWVITHDVNVVQAYGTMHDCAECRDNTRMAIRWLNVHPNDDLLVGQLWWAEQ